MKEELDEREKIFAEYSHRAVMPQKVQKWQDILKSLRFKSREKF